MVSDHLRSPLLGESTGVSLEDGGELQSGTQDGIAERR